MTTYVDPKLVAKALARVTKSSNVYYSNAVKKIKKNRKEYYQNKETKTLQKSLSKDRFNTYLEELYKADVDD